MPVKVLFLPTWYPSEANRIEGTFVQEHAKAAQLHDQVAVLYGEPEPSRDGFFNFWSNIEDGLPTYRFRFGIPRLGKPLFPLYLLATHKAFRRVTREWGWPQVIHAQEPRAAAVALVLRALYGLPYVVSEHWSAINRRTLVPKQAFLARLAFPRASRVLGANSKFPQDFQFYAINCDFRWLPNCMDTHVFFPPAVAAREPLVLHCSLFSETKRVPDLIQAFARCQAQLPEARLELIGDGPERAKTQELAEKCLKPNSYRFHGLQPKPVLAHYLRQARVFVLPSESENLPCVLIEAMACGTPVIATRVGDVDHLVGPAQGLLYEWGDVDTLARLLKAVLTGAYTFDSAGIADYASRNFAREAVGRILHEEHLRAAMGGKFANAG